MNTAFVKSMESDLKSEAVPRVLVVEDEPDIAALIAYQLTREGYRVETAGTGLEALQAVGRDIPDLVVLDRMLPGVDGLEVCRALKRDPRTMQIPIMMLTARSEETGRLSKTICAVRPTL